MPARMNGLETVGRYALFYSGAMKWTTKREIEFMPRKRTGRKKGGKNQGYFFRKGRGWVAWDGGAMPYLLHEDGTAIRRADETADVLKDAYARFRLQRGQEEEQASEFTLHLVCVAYLQFVQAQGADATLRMRADA